MRQIAPTRINAALPRLLFHGVPGMRWHAHRLGGRIVRVTVCLISSSETRRSSSTSTVSREARSEADMMGSPSRARPTARVKTARFEPARPSAHMLGSRRQQGLCRAGQAISPHSHEPLPSRARLADLLQPCLQRLARGQHLRVLSRAPSAQRLRADRRSARTRRRQPTL
jgi:hypothetical protein